MKLYNVEIDGIDFKDAPDFVDAFISYAEDENGRELTEDELNNIPSEVVYDYVINHLY